MGDRFYTQQLNKLGHCPGKIGRKKRMAWTDEQKQEVIAMYQDADPTPETSVEIVKTIAEEVEQSVNGVRMILSKAGVYLKANAKAAATKGGSTGGGRVSKQASQEALASAISDAGQEVDEDIVSKLTGKAAVYFTSVINGITK